MNRRQAREAAFVIIFQRSFTQDDLDTILENAGPERVRAVARDFSDFLRLLLACGHGARTSGEGAGADVFPVDPIVPCSAEKARAIPVQTGKTGRAAASAAALRMEKLPACREIPQRRLTGRRD